MVRRGWLACGLAVGVTCGGVSSSPPARAQSLSASYTIPYQTTLRETAGPNAGRAYEGDAYFKFAIFRQTTPGGARVPVWSQDPEYLATLDPGRAVEVPEPVRMVRTTVTGGLASFHLGGTDATMLEGNGAASTQPDGLGGVMPRPMAPLQSAVFESGVVRLRVWLGKTTSTFELLTPDLPLAASPFAIRAAVAEGVVPGAIHGASLSSDLGQLIAKLTGLAEVADRVGVLSDHADDTGLTGLGYRQIRAFPAAPYQRVGLGSPPTGRVHHTAAWTGTSLLVFGGSTSLNGALVAGGARYTPSNDTWVLLPTSLAPSPREGAGSVWTGERWLIWGGLGASVYLADGAEYDPVANKWASLPAPPVGFAGRRGHTAIWTGTHLLIWGGLSSGGTHADGAAYHPASKTWQMLPTYPGAGRHRHSAVWTGSRMVVWGGQGDDAAAVGTGYQFEPGANPSAGTWTAVPASPLAARHSHAAAWTARGMVIWGGLVNEVPVGDGALWENGSGTWANLPSATGFLGAAARVQTAGTGAGLYFFGGATVGGASGAAAYLDGTTLTGRAAPSPGPAGRFGHTLVTMAPADELLIFGGADPAVTGAYNDTWRLPAERTQYLYRKP